MIKFFTAAKKILATAFAVAAFGLSLSANAQAADAPLPTTAQAVECLVALAPPGCEAVFEPAWQGFARRSTTYCTVEYTHRWLDNCYSGPLETIAYLGVDPRQADVYAVNYLGSMTYVVSRPDAGGRIGWFKIFDSSHNAVPRDWGVIATPANSAQPFYTRPQEDN